MTGADNVGLTVIELNYYIEQFDRRLNAVDEAQSAVECELEGALLEADINEATEFRDKVREARVHAATRFAAMRLANYTIMAAIDGRKLTVRCQTDTVKANKVDLEERGSKAWWTVVRPWSKRTVV